MTPTWSELCRRAAGEPAPAFDRVRHGAMVSGYDTAVPESKVPHSMPLDRAGLGMVQPQDAELGEELE